MTITAVDQQPQTYSPAYNENMFLATSSGTAQTNFRFVFDVYATDGTTLILRVKLPARPIDSKGLFDAKRIIDNYLTYDLGTAGENAAFYRNDNSFYKYVVKIGEEYGSPTPTVYASQRTVSGIYVWNAAFDWFEFRDFLYTDYLMTLGLTGKPFLTNAPSTQNIELDQNAWLYMMTATSGSIRSLELKKYNSAGTLLDSKYILNTFYDLTGSEAHRFLRVAVGTKNINDHSPGWIDSDVSYYTAQVLSSTSATASTLRQYNVTDNCRFTTVRLHWLNPRGGFDSFGFPLKSYESAKIIKQLYTQVYGTTTGTWSYQSHDRGDTVFDSRCKSSFRIQSDWLTEEESTWLEELLLSPEVYHEYDSETFVAVQIRTDTYEKKKKVNSKLFALSVEFEYSYGKEAQRG
jgi:hypothetical protein